MRQLVLTMLLGCALGLGGVWLVSSREAKALEEIVRFEAALTHDIQLLEDENAIKNLQRAYGYYTDKKLWTQVADLFSENARVEFSQRGIVVTKDRIHNFLAVFSQEGIVHGTIANHFQLQPVISISSNGVTAKGRWRVLQMNGVYQSSANWGGGVYENEYIKEEGTWKISKLRIYNSFYLNYDTAWLSNAYPHAGISDDFLPDFPPSENYPIYPQVFVAPFHYENPVTGIQFSNP